MTVLTNNNETLQRIKESLKGVWGENRIKTRGEIECRGNKDTENIIQ